MGTTSRSTRNNPGLAARLALAAIRGYQRFISPHKGFSCPLRLVTGGAGCSAYGYAMIARHGLRRGLGLLDRRLALCSHAHARLRAAAPPPAPTLGRLHRQRGVCDVPCDCDLPHPHLPSCDSNHRCGRLPNFCSVFDLYDVCNVCDFCDWDKKRRRERGEREQRDLNAALERIRRNKQNKRR